MIVSNLQCDLWTKYDFSEKISILNEAVAS